MHGSSKCSLHAALAQGRSRYCKCTDRRAPQLRQISRDVHARLAAAVHAANACSSAAQGGAGQLECGFAAPAHINLKMHAANACSSAAQGGAGQLACRIASAPHLHVQERHEPKHSIAAACRQTTSPAAVHNTTARRTAGDEHGNARSSGEQHGGGDGGRAVQAQSADQRQVAARHLSHAGARACQPLQLNSSSEWGVRGGYARVCRGHAREMQALQLKQQGEQGISRFCRGGAAAQSINAVACRGHTALAGRCRIANHSRRTAPLQPPATAVEQPSNQAKATLACAGVSPKCGTPPRTAMVAGTAPCVRTTPSTCLAVSRF